MGFLGLHDYANLAMLNEVAFSKSPYNRPEFDYLFTWQKDHSLFNNALPQVGTHMRLMENYDGEEFEREECDSKWNLRIRNEYPSLHVDMCADGYFIPSVCREGGRRTGAASKEIAQRQNCKEVYATNPTHYKGEIESIIELLGLPLVVDYLGDQVFTITRYMIAEFRKQSARATAFWSAASERLEGSDLHTKLANVAMTIEATDASLSQAEAALKASSQSIASVLDGIKAVGFLVEALHEAITNALTTIGSAATRVNEIMEGLMKIGAYKDKTTAAAEAALHEAHTLLEATVTVTENMLGKSNAGLLAKPCEDGVVDMCMSLGFRQTYTAAIAATLAQEAAVLMRGLQKNMETLLTHPTRSREELT
eukprot:GHVR01171976.1.p1 GENE.GHVR01171976.1~~GHVR01171976.1.p1  ORF type:complete len:367 (+),score=77.92 GHVR01171976.1:336-1436(+)